MHVCMSLQRRLQPNAERAILFRSWLAALKKKKDEEKEKEKDWSKEIVNAVYHRFPSYWFVCRWMYLACFRSEQGACIKLISQMMKYVRESVCVICRAYVPIPLTAVERPLLAYSLSSSIETIEYHPELILLMLFRCYCDMQLNKDRLYIGKYHRYHSQR